MLPAPIAALSALLVVSGASALIYQVLWLRVLGLGPALRALTPVYVSLAPHLTDSLLPLTALRGAASIVILLVPATLMGATFPLAAKAALGRRDPRGDELAVLYAANTIGAIAGTLLAAFVLIGTIGVSGAFRLGAVMSTLVAIGAWWLSARLPGPVARPAAGDAAVWLEPVAISTYARRVVLLVFAISGFVSLALEIVWFRVLTLLLPATTSAFAVMLATVLLGIALGSASAPPIARRVRNLVGTLAIVELVIAAAIAWSARGLAASYDAFRVGEQLAGAVEGDFGFIPLAAAAAVSFLPAMLLMGLAFPLGLRAWTAGAGSAQGARVGQFYAVNLGAAILGAISGGFVILPLLGTRVSILTLAWLTAAGGILLATGLPAPRRAAFVTACAVVFVAFFASTRGLPDPVREVMAQRFRGERLFWHEEDIQTTATVNLQPFGRRVMYVNGLHQANDSPEMVGIHRQMGYLPVALHPAPRRALVIGLGGGATAGAVSRYPELEVDVVELSATVVRAAEHFGHVNFDVLRNPHVRVLVDDGRSHLLLSGRRYAEYFALAHEALAEGGLMLQWIGHREATQYTLIMRTFLNIFPDATL